MHDVADVNRSHCQGVRRGYFSRRLSVAEGVVRSCGSCCAQLGAEVRKPPNNSGIVVSNRK